jgi:L-ribulose-5-phosphate 4-epimerase
MSSHRSEKDFRKLCRDANLSLVTNSLTILTWGNVSILDHERSTVYIKPSGLPYESITPENIVAVDLFSGSAKLASSLKPSSDTPTHLELYRRWPQLGSIAHTHSEYATAYAQAAQPISVEGTTHADYFRGDIPCVPMLTENEVLADYESLTGRSIIAAFDSNNLNPVEIPGCLISHHGPFTWGRSHEDAVCHAIVLERLARMAVHSRSLSFKINPIPKYLLDRHYLRKNGTDAYYGQ